MSRLILLVCGVLALAGQAWAQQAPFDLRGPDLTVTVTRGGRTLPIAQVPGLAPGDRIDAGAVLPADQGAPYLLVAVFLRGATNPSPKDWFASARTWQPREATLRLTVPDGATQMLLFLVPRTGGDRAAVLHAVRGQPGAFVRATQDLDQASADRARLDRYLQAMRGRQPTDPAPGLLAQSLGVRVDTGCLDRPAELQAACLARARDALILTDRHQDGFTATLAGAPTDLALQVSATPQGGYGYYSPYIGVLRDLARMFGAFRSTQFQYIPALAQLDGERIHLLLNTAPSFRSPKSVLVVAMPPVAPVPPPPWRATEPALPVCLDRPDPVLPVAATPAIYATAHLHHVGLRLGDRDVAMIADPERGGFVPAGAMTASGPGEGALHGQWGFDTVDGPRVALQRGAAGAWKAGGGDPARLVAGRDNQLELTGGPAACVSGVVLDAGGSSQPIDWRVTGADRIAVTLPLAHIEAGRVTVVVSQFGAAEPVRLPLRAYTEPSRIDRFVLHAGDRGGTLFGTRLDLVTALSVDGVRFGPGTVVRDGKTDRLDLLADAPLALEAGRGKAATVQLSDGRELPLCFTVGDPRPALTVIARDITRPAATGPVEIVLEGTDLLAADARLTFSFRSPGDRLARGDTVEVADADGTHTATVREGDGLTLQDDHVAVATLVPARSLGASAHGPLRFRLWHDGAASDWAALPALVRLPTVTRVSCGAGTGCTLWGRDLFLIEAVSTRPGAAGVTVPTGFPGDHLAVPGAARPPLYLRLRDAPAAVARVVGRP